MRILPHYALLHRFAARVMGHIELEPQIRHRLVRHAVLVEQPQRAVQPITTPPLPPEIVTLACPGQVVPNLFLHPVADVREAATRVTDRKVLHPAAQNGIDTRNHVCDGPRPMTSKDRLERLQQCRPLLSSRRPERHPSASPLANPRELKSEKPEALALHEVHSPTLLLVDCDLSGAAAFQLYVYRRPSGPVRVQISAPGSCSERSAPFGRETVGYAAWRSRMSLRRSNCSRILRISRIARSAINGNQ